MAFDDAGKYPFTLYWFLVVPGADDDHGHPSSSTLKANGKAAGRLVSNEVAEQSERAAEFDQRAITFEVRSEKPIAGWVARWRGIDYRIVSSVLVAPMKTRISLVLHVADSN